MHIPPLDRDLESDSPTLTNSISAGLASGLLGSSAPVNIPGANRNALDPFSPSNNSPLQLHSSFLSSRFSQPDHIDSWNHSQMPLSSSASKVNSFTNFFDFASQSLSPSSRNHNSFSISPSVNGLEVMRLREELTNARAQLNENDARFGQMRSTCEAWQRESEETSRKIQMMDTKLQEAVSQYNALKQEYEKIQTPHLHSITNISELSKLNLSVLKGIQAQLRQDLEEVDKVLYRETASKCMVCEERNRTVTLNCNHFVLCSTCVLTQTECPYCQTPINLTNNM